ncbi:hypothetical protein VM1G_03432 [Cytospora mali]|uniref:Uncharacterized protein n=1 Tax=Cytospora mali TaxID=578113 RepID=A0A194VSY9_CYTMA|nr:hypothetical protein VM1G_03432 [Valsa mali]
MAEPQGDGLRGPRDKKYHNAAIHRINDFLLGHIGQVSYKPVGDEDVDIGYLGSNRKFEQLPSLHQVLPFEEWFPPTRSGLAVPPSRTFQRVKSQRYWLLKTHPDAYLGNADLPKLVSEQARAARDYDSAEENQIASVLAIGEITDLRNPSRSGSWPVVAMAAGEAAHILRISSMNLEDWSCGEHSLSLGSSSAHGPVATGGAQPTFQGLWCSDGTAISQLKFATKLKQRDPLRWLIVQKRSSTTVFEPEIRAKPVENTVSMLSIDVGGEEHIAANPIVTLTTNDTGGDTHCDFSINLGWDEDAPQIAVIDRSGNWSVWYIERERHGIIRTTKAVPKNKGNWDLPPSSGLINGTGFSEGSFRINWAAELRKADDWERDSNASDNSRVLPNTLWKAYLAGLNTTQSRFERLLISNNTQLQVLDANTGFSKSWLSFLRRDRTDVLLDAQVFPGSTSHFFVFTTEKLYLLHISDADDQEASRLVVLVSCPHFLNHGGEGLKMSVTRLQVSHHRASSLVLLHSAKNSRVRVLYFTISFQDGTANFHHQMVHFPGLEASSSGNLPGIECLSAVPLQLSALRRRRSRFEANKTYKRSNGVQFYQIFRLAPDLSLSSSVVAVTSGTAGTLTRPIKSAGPHWDEARRTTFLRKKLLRDAEKAFVIPDVVEEDKQLSVIRPEEGAVTHDTLQLRYYLVKVVEEINRGFFGQSASESMGSIAVDPFGPIQEALENQEADDHTALKPLLSFSQIWQPLDLPEVDVQWDAQMRQLQKSSSIQLFECGRYGSRLGVLDFFEAFSVNWSARLPAESLKAVQWRYIELLLERMAAEVYLSEKGVYRVPTSTMELALKASPRGRDRQVSIEDDVEDLPHSQPRSDAVLPTPSATPSSSRATSEAADQSQRNEEDGEQQEEDPAVTRLRMYLPSIKFTPPAKQGQSRVLSLWPEQRGSDPAEYKYSPTGKPDAESEAAKRRRERDEERRRRRAERRAQIGVKMERSGEAFSQPLMPSFIRSSPPPQMFANSQAPMRNFGFDSQQSQGQSQGQSQSQGFGFSQTMSQPLPGEFGARESRLRKKAKAKKKAQIGFR